MPDLIFTNEKSSRFHNVTTENKVGKYELYCLRLEKPRLGKYELYCLRLEKPRLSA